jgi:hypothetical protein
MGDIQRFLIEKYDRDYAYRMLDANPYRIVTGREVPSYAVDPQRG